VAVEVVNSNLVPENHTFEVRFLSHPDSVHAETYALVDNTTGETFFDTGIDFDGKGIGPTGSGLLPVVLTNAVVQSDTANTGFLPGSTTDAKIHTSYVTDFLNINLLRPGFPDDLRVEFSDTIVDTSTAMSFYPARPVKFRVFAETASGDLQLDFRYREADADSMFDKSTETLDVITYHSSTGAAPQPTWRLSLQSDPVDPPGAGDVFHAAFVRAAFAARCVSLHEPWRAHRPANGERAVPSLRGAESVRCFSGLRAGALRGFGARGTAHRIPRASGAVHDSDLHGSRRPRANTRSRRIDGKGLSPGICGPATNLDLAPGLYIFQVDGGDLGSNTGKFAVVK
jgi:hypothetical protein